MNQILTSASKIVLLLMTAALIVGLFIGRIDQETFKTALLMVFTFYFAYKGSEKSSGDGQQFAGK
jgi:FtsH-binding integral membrane protein